MPIQLISYLQDTGFDLYNMREWLSGGAPPCQGGGRGFDPRLALIFLPFFKGFAGHLQLFVLHFVLHKIKNYNFEKYSLVISVYFL